MINPRKVARFLFHFFAAVAPVFAALLLLALITELAMQRTEWPSLLTSPRFWLAIARDLVPGTVALLGVYLLASLFVRAVYGIGRFTDARGWLEHRLFGLFSFRPWIRILQGAVEGGPDHILARAGGPGSLVIYDDTAVLLHRAGRFTRIEGGGFVELEAFEKPYVAVDLRPIRHVQEVEAMTREGIPVRCEVDITFQIDSQGAGPTAETEFPISVSHVFKAATGHWIAEADWTGGAAVFDWAERLATIETEAGLRAILARYPLDFLIGLGGMADSREKIRRQLEDHLQSVAQELGARASVQLGNIRVEHKVTQQWIDAWQAEWQYWESAFQAQGRAEQIELVESAKTRAQVATIALLTEALRPLVDSDEEITSKLVLTRLFMALSRASADPLTRVYLPQEAVRTLQLLRELVV